MPTQAETGETGVEIPVGGVSVSVSSSIGGRLSIKPKIGETVDALLNFSWTGVSTR